MSWHEIDTWIVVIAVLCAVACALPGTFLVLRHMSMMGDAISHAVLPGLAVGFLLTGSRASVPMFLAAAAAGALTALFTQWISRFGNVDRGASMGIVFTTLFAIGLLLIRQAADHVDLDPGCVLYGAIELAALDTVTFLGMEVRRAVIVLGCILLLNLAFVLLLFKELRISAFDPELATTLGINASLMHYLLMVIVAVTTVAAFEAVGSIIVVAMFIVPSATAHLLTDRLPAMLAISAALAAIAAVIGHILAITVPTWFGFEDASTSGMIAVTLGLMFGLCALFAPKYGYIARRLHRAHARA